MTLWRLGDPVGGCVTPCSCVICGGLCGPLRGCVPPCGGCVTPWRQCDPMWGLCDPVETM